MESLILVYIFVIVVGFVVLRIFWLWYWKVDKIVDALERIDSKLTIIKDANKKTTKSKAGKKSDKLNLGGKTSCPLCHTTFDSDAVTCPNCGRNNDDKK